MKPEATCQVSQSPPLSEYDHEASSKNWTLFNSPQMRNLEKLVRTGSSMSRSSALGILGRVHTFFAAEFYRTNLGLPGDSDRAIAVSCRRSRKGKAGLDRVEFAGS
jgi:hypothetical protein